MLPTQEKRIEGVGVRQPAAPSAAFIERIRAPLKHQKDQHFAVHEVVVDQSLKRFQRRSMLQIRVGNHLVHQVRGVIEQQFHEVGAGAAETVERRLADASRLSNILERTVGVVNQRNGQGFQKFVVSGR